MKYWTEFKCTREDQSYVMSMRLVKNIMFSIKSKPHRVALVYWLTNHTGLPSDSVVHGNAFCSLYVGRRRGTKTTPFDPMSWVLSLRLYATGGRSSLCISESWLVWCNFWNRFIRSIIYKVGGFHINPQSGVGLIANHPHGSPQRLCGTWECRLLPVCRQERNQDNSLCPNVLSSLPLLTFDGRQVYPCVFQNRNSCGLVFGTDLFGQLYIR